MLKQILNTNRGTGRTTRMVHAAVIAANKPNAKKVCIIAHSHQGAIEVHNHLKGTFLPERINNIEVFSVGNSVVRRRESEYFIEGRPDALVFVDHWVYAEALRRMSGVFEGLTRYDV